MTAHVGTHIDALGHFTIGDRLYNGLSAAEVVTDWGLDRLGIEHAPPMVTRGVLLDVAGFDGGEFLEPGRVIAPDDLARAEAAAGVVIEPGDIVLIRTGWGRFFGVDNPRYLQGEPGINVPAAQWLTQRDVVAIGCDNMAVEVLPNPDRNVALPVHHHVLVEAGVYLIEESSAGGGGAGSARQLLLYPACDKIPRRHRLPGPPCRAGLARFGRQSGRFVDIVRADGSQTRPLPGARSGGPAHW